MNKMNEESKQEMQKSSPMMEELITEMLSRIKSLTNTVTGQGAELKAYGELIKNMPAHNPVVKEFAKRMEELEFNVQDILRRLEEMIRNFEAGCKLIWDTAKSNEKIRRDFDAFMQKMRSDFDRFIQNHSLSKDIQLLRDDMAKFIRFFEVPRHKDVHYTHFMGKTLILTIGLVFIILVEGVFLSQAWGQIDRRKENDIKWRCAKLYNRVYGIQTLPITDSFYKKMGPEAFSKAVEDEEDRRQALFEKQLQIDEAQGEIEKLEQKKKSR
jgi:hypothetical protein